MLKIANHKIVHICVAEKFMRDYVDFVNSNFDPAEHIFLFVPSKLHPLPEADNVINLGSRDTLIIFRWIIAMAQARKIILHGLIGHKIFITLAIFPWLLKKCYWTIWGGDLYYFQKKKEGIKSRLFENIRSFVIGRIGHYITHIEGDYRLAQQWYGAKGEWHECFMYPSNLYQEPSIQTFPHEGINMLLGNSADPSNNHIEVLDNLRLYAGENIRVYCPLSYGDKSYAQRISDYGSSLLGDKFIPLRDFMPFDKYAELLAKIDIAIFNHHRQQGMGNTTTLLGMGKKIFMRSDVTPYMMFHNLGIKVYPVKNLDLNKIDSGVALANSLAIKNFFSIDRLKEQWRVIYD